MPPNVSLTKIKRKTKPPVYVARWKADGQDRWKTMKGAKTKAEAEALWVREFFQGEQATSSDAAPDDTTPSSDATAAEVAPSGDGDGLHWVGSAEAIRLFKCNSVWLTQKVQAKALRRKPGPGRTFLYCLEDLEPLNKVRLGRNAGRKGLGGRPPAKAKRKAKAPKPTPTPKPKQPAAAKTARRTRAPTPTVATQQLQLAQVNTQLATLHDQRPAPDMLAAIGEQLARFPDVYEVRFNIPNGTTTIDWRHSTTVSWRKS